MLNQIKLQAEASFLKKPLSFFFLSVGASFYLISLTKLTKASSQFWPVLADVSRKSIPSSLAKSCPYSFETFLFSSKSALLPKRIADTFWKFFILSILYLIFLISWKDTSLSIEYTSKYPFP